MTMAVLPLVFFIVVGSFVQVDAIRHRRAHLPTPIQSDDFLRGMPPLPKPAPVKFENVATPEPEPLFEEVRPVATNEKKCHGETTTVSTKSGTITWRPPWTASERLLKDIDSCYWLIRVPKDKRIKYIDFILKFINLKFFYHSIG